VKRTWLLGVVGLLSASGLSLAALGGGKARGVTLEGLLEENGWTAVADLDDQFQLAAVIIPRKKGRYETLFLPGECFVQDGAQVGDLGGGTTISSQLQMGVRIPLVPWAAAAETDKSGSISLLDPTTHRFSTHGLRPSQRCVQTVQLDLQSGKDLSKAFVIRETLRARVSEDSCLHLGSEVGSFTGKASVAVDECRKRSNSAAGSVIGYRVFPLREVREFIVLFKPSSAGGWGGAPVPASPPPSAELSGSLPPTPARSSPADAGVRMKRVEPSTFQMGSDAKEFQIFPNARMYEEYQHSVTLTRPFLVGVTEVTQAQYTDVMGSNPTAPRFRDDNKPVVNVSWADAIQFCNRLSEREGLQPAYRRDGDFVHWDPQSDGYRLPTEAEWERAARAEDGAYFAGSSRPESVAWIAGLSDEMVHPVGAKAANGWGLHDMSGNAFEWVWDAFDAYPQRGVSDPVGVSSFKGRVSGDCGTATWDHRVARGGSWKWGWGRDKQAAYGLGLARVAARAYFKYCHRDDDTGFRVVRTAR